MASVVLASRVARVVTLLALLVHKYLRTSTKVLDD
jgi:hypothetical protein